MTHPTRALVVGHGDWGLHDLRWTRARPHAVHDWDSVIAQPEPAVVGSAAAVWPADQVGRHAATVEGSAAFIDAYTAHTGARWTSEDHHLT